MWAANTKRLGAACLRCASANEKTPCPAANFARNRALAAAALAAAPSDVFALTQQYVLAPIRRFVWRSQLHLPQFHRAEMITFLKQLNVLSLNAKDVKDHSHRSQQEAAALADYAAAGVKASRRRNHLFPQRRRRRHPQQVRILQASRDSRNRRR